MEEKNEKKSLKIIVIIIAALLVIGGVVAFIYLKNREKTPEDAITLVKDGKEEVINLEKLELTDFEGEVVNGKGEKKEIDAEGVKLSEIIGTSDFSEATVTADDAYSATIHPEDLENAWLEVEDGEAVLIVFGDENSKRNVKDVARIEVK